MDDYSYTVRRQLIQDLNIPLNKSDLRWFTARQRMKVLFWEWTIQGTLLVKRLLDIVVSAMALIALLPLFMLVAIAIYREDGRPFIFVQNRVGLNGRLFRFYKFRSMFKDAEKRKTELKGANESADGVTFKMKQDPRVTKSGRFIRRFSIDETLQFYNVLRGDISLVGPRPPVPKEVEQYTLEQRKRLHVKPGLTCIWQISGRSDIPFKQQVQLDLTYIRNRGLLQDIIIILKTIPAVLLGRGAY
jgi:lipopolysaccharide/colanic/teichoic acid biosynthesis glycosyltransferase